MKKESRNKRFADLSIRKKLTISFTLIIITTFILIVILLCGMKYIEGRLTKLYNGPTMNIHYSSELYYPQLDIQRAVNRTMAEGVDKLDETYPQLEETINKNLTIMEDAYENLQSNLLTQEDRESLEAIHDKLTNEVTGHREEVLSLLQQGDFEAAGEYNDNYYKPAVDEVKVMIEELEAYVMDTAADYESSSTTMALLLILTGIFLLILITVIAVILALKVTKSIVHPINEITEAAKKMRIGELSVAGEITHESQDELGVLAQTMRETANTLEGYVNEIVENFERVAQGDLTQDFEKITDFLGNFNSIKKSFVKILKDFNITLTQIQETASQVDSGSDEIAGAATDLAAGTEEQSSAVEELTATIDTISNMAEKAAKEAEEEYNNIMRSVEEARKEMQQMEELQEEMHRIKEISNEIEEIITSIEEIASQTSLLSLNASIEAARAGEAGKGFAVVADQIGKLATDSAQAVVNTKELIGKTVEEIDKGNKVTETTAVGYERIIKELGIFADSAKVNSEISKEQADALSQVEDGIEQIAQVTQQNAAASQECSAISQELSARATELNNLVEQFKLYSDK